MIKKLTIFIVVVAGLWAGYWFWGASKLEGEYERWFEERRADGWQAEYSALDLRGFPNRFDATWRDLSLADPETGLAWEAPFFQLFMLSYRPNHVIAIWPDTHVLSTPIAQFEIANDALQASLVTDPAPSLPLARANLASDTMTIKDAAGGTTSLAALRAGIQREEGSDTSYRIAANVDGLALSAPLLQRVGGNLPEAFNTAKLDMTIGFDRPWDLSAVEDARPQPRQIALRVAEAEWGPMLLRLAGDLEIDETGRATGEVSLQAREWQAMLDLAVASEALPRAVADALRDGLRLLAGFSGNADALDLDLRLDRGRIFVGPLPLGEAPRFILR